MQVFSRKVNFNAAFQTGAIRKDVQAHLVKVYLALAATLVFAAAGSAIHLMFNLGGLLTLLGAMGLIVMLALTPATRDNELIRLGYLFGIGFLKGCTLGPMIGYVLDLDPSIIVSAFSGTVAVFACFSGSALLAERRSALYLGGFLGSALSLLFWLSFLNLFFWSSWIYTLQLYGGLLVFCGFVIFDTQLIIEKASMGSKDYVTHSLELFLDFVNIFVRLVAILSKGKKKNNK